MTTELAKNVAVASIAVASAVVLSVTGNFRDAGFDSYLHVFIAQQPTWSDWWYEVNLNAHPPLYYLLLSGTMELFGHSLAAYRLVSIAATVASVVLVQRITEKITGSVAMALAAAAMYGLSANVVEMGLEIRAYALSNALMLTAFLLYLDSFSPTPRVLGGWRACIFATATACAVLTHYANFFFVAGLASAPVFLAALSGDWRANVSRLSGLKSMQRLASLMIPALLAGVVVYLTHARGWAGNAMLVHVAPFIFDAHTESVTDFLWRTGSSLARLFFPSEAVALFYASMVAAAVLISIGRRRFLSALPALMLFVMLVLNAVAAIAARYPFGGELRHEMFLFPFAVLAGFAAVDSIRGLVRGWASSRPLWATAAGAVVAANTVAWFSPTQMEYHPLFQAETDGFRAAIGTPKTVVVDQFGTVAFFSRHHDWTWKHDERDSSQLWQFWDVTNGHEHVRLCRSRQWQLDFTQAATYGEISECLKHSGTREVAVFRPQLPGLQPSWGSEEPTGLIRRNALGHELAPEMVVVQHDSVYATFARAGNDGVHK